MAERERIVVGSPAWRRTVLSRGSVGGRHAATEDSCQPNRGESRAGQLAGLEDILPARGIDGMYVYGMEGWLPVAGPALWLYSFLVRPSPGTASTAGAGHARPSLLSSPVAAPANCEGNHLSELCRPRWAGLIGHWPWGRGGDRHPRGRGSIERQDGGGDGQHSLWLLDTNCNCAEDCTVGTVGTLYGTAIALLQYLL